MQADETKVMKHNSEKILFMMLINGKYEYEINGIEADTQCNNN